MRLQIPYGKLSGYKVGKILKHFVADIEASKATEVLGLNANTTDAYYQLFRRLIREHQLGHFSKLSGVVELDESYFGARRVRGRHIKLKRGRGTRKQPVFGVYERGGRVYTQVVPNCSGKTLQAIVEHVVEINGGRTRTEINTDGWRGYDGLVDVGYDKHYRVNHSKDEFSDFNGHHVNGIEAFWSYTKRRLVMFNGVKKTHFELFLKECEWRYNRDHDELEAELKQLLNTYIRKQQKQRKRKDRG
jgi:transposase-like protein